MIVSGPLPSAITRATVTADRRRPEPTTGIIHGYSNATEPSSRGPTGVQQL